MIKNKSQFSTIKYLKEQGYRKMYIAIVMGIPALGYSYKIKELEYVESTNKFMTKEQKIRLYVLNKFLQLKPVCVKWDSNDYYYVTILNFLQIPHDTIRSIYKHAPTIPLAKALKTYSPRFQDFNYSLLDITLEEYKLFVTSCYHFIGDFTKMH